MKLTIKNFAFVAAFCLLAAANAFSQTGGSVWAVDFVKSKNGQQANYLKFIELNWAVARQTLKEKGDVVSYRVFSLPVDAKAEWDVLLLTEYKNRETWEKREEIFGEVFKTRPTAPVNGMTSGRQMADIKFDRVFASPVSSETARVMLENQTTDAETAAARVPLENYLKGQATGDGEFMRKAFHTEGNMTFVRDGKFMSRSFTDFIAGFTGKPAPDEDKRKRWIELVEVTGNAAIGKIVLDYPNVKFVDYMTLLKIGGEWKIVNKSFFAEPKTVK